MDSNTTTSQNTNKLDDKTTVISKKVWDLEKVSRKTVRVNQQDGSVPIELQKSLKDNEIRFTDYTGTDGQKVVFKKDNRIYSFNMMEET